MVKVLANFSTQESFDLHDVLRSNASGRNAADAERWRASRMEAGLRIDPETAEVAWIFADACDPYCLSENGKLYCVGRTYFARSPGSRIWVWLGDLPDKTRAHLSDVCRRRFAAFNIVDDVPG